MTQWLNEVQGLTLKGQIAVPYTWWVGETGSRFLLTLKEDQKIMGSKCETCGKVYVPARKNCGTCFTLINDWVEVGPEGTVEGFTVVRYPFKLHPVQEPFAYVLIKLDGADVSFLHIIKEKIEDLSVGTRVRARFAEEREGHILDIDSFDVVGKEN